MGNEQSTYHLVIYTLHQMLLRRANQEEWDERVI